jgi:hypothetical protein
VVRTIDRTLWTVAAALMVVAIACNDPQSPKRDAPSAVLTDGILSTDGTLTAEMHTTVGAPPDASSFGSIDPDGYTVWLDGAQSQAVATNGIVTFSGLAAGDHEVALYGIAPNCTVNTLTSGSSNPRTVSVIAGALGVTDFDLGCGSWGGLFVTTNTTGVDLDADGYTVTVDGGANQVIAANGSVTFTQLYASSHTITLSGLSGNCTLSGSNSRAVIIAAGKTASLTFSASCTPTGQGSGTLTVVTNTTGSNLDADGYTVTIDGAVSQAIATTNDSVTFTGPAGDHPVALSGVASNCAVSGANPGTVTVPAGGTGTTTFSVACGVPQPTASGTGQIGMGSSPTPGPGVQTFDFDVRADLTGRFTYTDYSDIHPDGDAATLTTDPATDAATAITAYRNGSAACSDPSRGAEFDAVGRTDENEVIRYTVIVCDGGPAGSGADFFSFYTPPKQYGRSGVVTSGDIVQK